MTTKIEELEKEQKIISEIFAVYKKDIRFKNYINGRLFYKDKDYYHAEIEAVVSKKQTHLIIFEAGHGNCGYTDYAVLPFKLLKIEFDKFIKKKRNEN